MTDLLRRIYQAFDPSPLTAEQEHLSVDLGEVRGDGQAAKQIENKIRLSGTKKIAQVLAGHVGSGKSTELQRLQKFLEEPGSDGAKYFVVYFSVDEHVDRNDVDFLDVLVATIRQLAVALKDRAGIVLKPGYFRDCWERIKRLMGSDVELNALSLAAGMLQLSGVIRTSPDARQELRKLFEPDAGNWLHAANDVISKAVLELAGKGYKDLVIIADDLEKMIARPLESAGCLTTEYLFVHRAAQLTGFHCHMVYSMPISLAYSHQQETIKRNFGGAIPVVPMAKIAHRPPGRKANTAGIKCFEEMIRRRLKSCDATPDDLFEPPAALQRELIRLTGGQPTALMTMVREAIITEGLPIRKPALDRVRYNGRRDFARQLLAEDWKLLKEVAKDGTISRTDQNQRTVARLIDSRAVLQYVNHDEWYDVNPLIQDFERRPVAPRRKRPK